MREVIAYIGNLKVVATIFLAAFLLLTDINLRFAMATLSWNISVLSAMDTEMFTAYVPIAKRYVL